MLSGVQIRARRRSDFDPVLVMARATKALDDYPPRGPLDVDHFLTPPEGLAAWVAEADDAVVGHVALHQIGTGTDDGIQLAAAHAGKAPHDLVLVARLLVSPTARRTGVGHALLDTAVDGAHEGGRQPILGVATHLAAAVALYESCGWERAGAVTIPVDDEPDLGVYIYVGPALTRR
jgi:GNAT superfamily N-acetyltransferase